MNEQQARKAQLRVTVRELLERVARVGGPAAAAPPAGPPAGWQPWQPPQQQQQQQWEQQQQWQQQQWEQQQQWVRQQWQQQQEEQQQGRQRGGRPATAPPGRSDDGDDEDEPAQTTMRGAIFTHNTRHPSRNLAFPSAAFPPPPASSAGGSGRRGAAAEQQPPRRRRPQWNDRAQVAAPARRGASLWPPLPPPLLLLRPPVRRAYSPAPRPAAQRSAPPSPIPEPSWAGPAAAGGADAAPRQAGAWGGGSHYGPSADASAVWAVSMASSRRNSLPHSLHSDPAAASPRDGPPPPPAAADASGAGGAPLLRGRIGGARAVGAAGEAPRIPAPYPAQSHRTQSIRPSSRIPAPAAALAAAQRRLPLSGGLHSSPPRPAPAAPLAAGASPDASGDARLRRMEARMDALAAALQGGGGGAQASAAAARALRASVGELAGAAAPGAPLPAEAAWRLREALRLLEGYERSGLEIEARWFGSGALAAADAADAAAARPPPPAPCRPPPLPADAVGEGALCRVMAGRKALLREQAEADGRAYDGRRLRPGVHTAVVERLADEMLSELLAAHAADVGGVCDEVADALIAGELAPPPDSGSGGDSDDA